MYSSLTAVLFCIVAARLAEYELVILLILLQANATGLLSLPQWFWVLPCTEVLKPVNTKRAQKIMFSLIIITDKFALDSNTECSYATNLSSSSSLMRTTLHPETLVCENIEEYNRSTQYPLLLQLKPLPSQCYKTQNKELWIEQQYDKQKYINLLTEYIREFVQHKLNQYEK